VVRNTATILNHTAVSIIIIIHAIATVDFGVSGDMTSVNNPKKNNVALGFNTLVKNPL